MSLTQHTEDSTDAVSFIESNRALSAQLESLRHEFADGFVTPSLAEVKPTHQLLQHIRDHLRDPSRELSDPTERRYFRFIRRGGKWGAKMPPVEAVRLPFTTLIDDDYEFTVVGDGAESRVAIIFTLTSEAVQRYGYRFVAPHDINAPFAALTFKESLESGRLGGHYSMDARASASVIWLN